MADPRALAPDLGPVLAFDRAQLDGSIAARFESQIEALADTEALRANGVSLTYEALNSHANALAHELVAITGGDEALVALLLDDGPLTVVAMIATLKAGAGYVAVDPELPAARLEKIIVDARPAVIVTKDDLRAILPELADATPIVTFEDLRNAALADNPELDIDPGRLAAVYYTSGSTGEPKGIEWDQRFALHMAWAFGDHFGLAAGSRFSALHPLTFAAGGHDVFQALLNGYTLCFFDVRRSGLSALGDWLSDERITVLHPAVALFRRFIGSIDTRPRLPYLRAVILGGDALLREDVERYFARVDSDAVLVSRLAMSEANVIARNVITMATDFEGDTVPAGYPVQDKQVWAVDAAGERLGPDDVGELVVATRFASRGYRNRPDLTAKKFTRTPDGQWAFATGDSGLVRQDGCVERIGRIDRQVKIRGHRVEIEEVERTLRKQAGISHAAVVSRADPGNDPRLAAYVVLRNQQWPLSDIRRAAQRVLPDYMVPATFTVLSRLPALASGKVDYESLQARSTPQIVRSDDFVAPRNATERDLAHIWEQLLTISNVGIDDDFFDLAGDSLVALQMFFEIEKALGVRFPVTILLEAPTIRRLALLIEAQSDGSPPSSLVPVQPLGSKPAFFCVPPAGRTVIILKDLSRRLGTDQPFFGLQTPGMEGRSAPLRRVEDMAALFLEEVKSVQPSGPYFLGGMCFGATIAFEMACQLQKQGESVATLAMLDSRVAPQIRYKVDPETRRRHLPHRAQRTLRHIRWVRSWVRLTARVVRRGDFLSTCRRRVGPILSRYVARASLRSDDVEAPAREVFRLHREAGRIYKAGDYSGRIDLFWTEDNSPRGKGELEDWYQLAGEPPNVHVVPGSHGLVDSFIREPNVGALAKALSVSLEMAAREEYRDRSTSPE